MINPIPSTIEGVLGASVQYAVPKYQRPYTWSKEEAVEFFEDLESYSESGTDNLFLGSLIFDTSEESKGRVTVIDGQQRLTTIVLLLVACRNVAKHLGEGDIAAQTQSMITFVDRTTGRPKGCRLIASETIRGVFEELCGSDWDGTFSTKAGKRGKRQIRRVRPIYEHFEEKLRQADQARLSKFLGAIYRTEVVRMEVQNRDEAFKIFERTNARGIDLEASDLLKNYLFAHEVPDLEETWTQIIENSDGTILRMLKYFYVAKVDLVRKPELYRKMKAYAREVGAGVLLQELNDFSRFYSAVRTANKESLQGYLDGAGCHSIVSDQDKLERLHIALDALQLFKIVQVYPLIYASISCFTRLGGGDNSAQAKRLIAFLDALEKYHFINNMVCERLGNEVEILYAEFCKAFRAATDFDETSRQLIGQLKGKLASANEFISRFEEISYKSDPIALLCYIFDRINNFGLAPGQRIPIFNPDRRLLRRNHNIEHFFPVNPEDGTRPTASMTEAAHGIGNLLAISFRTNSKLGNISPERKVEKLRGPLAKEIDNLQYVREFLETYGPEASSWDENSIAKRAKQMALDAYQRVWKIA